MSDTESTTQTESRPTTWQEYLRAIDEAASQFFREAENDHHAARFAHIMNLCMAARSSAQSSSEGTPGELRLRRLVWLRHPCADGGNIAALYGDDGEMQCGTCRFDFRRATPDDIELHIIALNTTAAASRTTEQSPK